MGTRLRRILGIAAISLGCAGSPAAPTTAVDPPAEESAPETLPDRAPVTTRSVAGIALPETTLLEGDRLWEEVGGFLEEPVPDDTRVLFAARQPSGPLVDWITARSSYVDERTLAVEEAEQLDPAMRAETLAALDLVREQALLGGAQLVLSGMLEMSEAEIAEQQAPRITEDLAAIAKNHNECAANTEVPLEWRLFCKSRRASLVERFGPDLEVDTDAVLALRRAGRARRLGPSPPGPARCFEPRRGDLESGLSGLAELMSRTMAATVSGLHQAFDGDLKLIVGTDARSPLTEQEAATVARRVERRAAALTAGQVTGVGETERATAQWRRDYPCRAALGVLGAARQAAPETAVGEIRLECSDGDTCHVELWVHQPFSDNSDEVPSWIFTSAVRSPLDPATWAAAADGLELADSTLTPPDPDVFLAAGRTSIAFGVAPESLAAVETALTECRVDFPSRFGALWLVDGRGRATIELRGDSADVPCAREAIEGATPDFGSGPGRVLVDVNRVATPSPRERAFGFEAGQARVRLNGVPRDRALESAIARCQLDHGKTDAAVGMAFTLVVTESNKPGVNEEALGDPSAEYQRCVRDAVGATTRGCETLPFEGVVCSMPAELFDLEG